MKHSRFVLLLTVLFVIACNSTPPDLYFPLDNGRYWRYEMTYQTMDGIFLGTYAVENLGQLEIDNKKLYVRRLIDGSLNYFRLEKDGIQLLAREKTEDLQTTRNEEYRYLFRFPLQAGMEWEDSRDSKVLIKTGPPQKTEFHISASIPVTVKIESMDDVIKVPAGTFTGCMRVRTKGNSFVNAGNYVGKTIVKLEEVNWYAPGVGLVKSERTENTTKKALDKGTITLELAEYRE